MKFQFSHKKWGITVFCLLSQKNAMGSFLGIKSYVIIGSMVFLMCLWQHTLVMFFSKPNEDQFLMRNVIEHPSPTYSTTKNSRKLNDTTEIIQGVKGRAQRTDFTAHDTEDSSSLLPLSSTETNTDEVT